MVKFDYTSNKHNWQTPKSIYQPILDFIGREQFDIDVCCSTSNIPADSYYSLDFYLLSKNGIKYNIVNQFDGLQANWGGICFLNPPYGRLLEKFVKKAFEESQKDCEVWSILPVRTENNYYHDYIFNNPNCFFVLLQGKQGFINPEKPEEKIKPTLPCMIVYWGKYALIHYDNWNREQPLKGKAFYCGN